MIASTYIIHRTTQSFVDLFNFVNNKEQIQSIKRNPGVKIKLFKLKTRYKHTVRERFESLYKHGYTHIVNMRGGRLSKIKKIAQYYKIILLDEVFTSKNY